MELKHIAASLAKFHDEISNIPKDADNPFFKSKYAPLESILPAIKEPLKKSGLVFTQIPSGLNKLKTLVIDVASGESIEGEYEMSPAKNDPQGQGSALTYMRRYALVAMLGLNTDEDDDGNHASEVANRKVSTPAGTLGARPPGQPAPLSPAAKTPPPVAPRIMPPTISRPPINPDPNAR